MSHIENKILILKWAVNFFINKIFQKQIIQIAIIEILQEIFFIII